MNQQHHFIIEHLVEKNSFNTLVFFEKDFYTNEIFKKNWTPMSRVLVDSDLQQLIYIVDIEGEWIHLRFPISLWKQLDKVIANQLDLFLVMSLTEEGTASKTIPLKDFAQEGKDLIQNMRGNSNYGEGMSELIEDKFASTIQQLV